MVPGHSVKLRELMDSLHKVMKEEKSKTYLFLNNFFNNIHSYLEYTES
jgi:hypothetical protein